jgi:hypothetical protein
VADKLLKRASTMPRLDAPEDKSITTLYIGGLGDAVTDTELKYGPPSAGLAAICFTSPSSVMSHYRPVP